VLETGSVGLDILLNGGWKPGTINEIWGEPSSGKTTLGLHAVHRLTPPHEHAVWMILGTEMPNYTFGAMRTYPRNAEQAFEIMIKAAEVGVALIVVDSANGLVRQAEIDGDESYEPDPHREYKHELRALRDAVRASGTVVIFLSKPRARDRNYGVRGVGLSDLRNPKSSLYDPNSAKVTLKIVTEHQDKRRQVRAAVGDDHTSFLIRPGSGLDWALELAHLGIRYEFIRKAGAWYVMNTISYQGIDALVAEIEDNSRLALALEEGIRSAARIQ
jgi:recombination protein RecA